MCIKLGGVMNINKEVKIRGPDQGLGPIPVSKYEVLGLIPK